MYSPQPKTPEKNYYEILEINKSAFDKKSEEERLAQIKIQGQADV